MRFSFFITFHARRGDARASAADIAWAVDVARATPGLAKGMVYTPESAPDPFVDYPPPPQLAFQLQFEEIGALEAAAGPAGHLQALARPGALASVDKSEVRQQAMLTRAFQVPDPVFRTPAGEWPCSDIIHYPGTADDLNAWLRYYVENHAPLMVRLPGIRAVEIYTRIDWISSLPWPRLDYMQRNKVVFDSAAAAAAAMQSPLRAEMRQDFLNFPTFTDGNRHNPMATRFVAPA
jgi:uncharacterized protein (TIGR02118 family)